MRFSLIDCDAVVQVNDKIRIDASQCFGTVAITNVEIQPEAAESFYTVFNSGDTSRWYLDWLYVASGAKVISVRVTDAGGNTTTTKSITVVTEASDYLFSNDDELKVQEPDIMKWLPAGRSSYKFVHRKVQDAIITEIYKSGISSTDGTKITKTQVIDVKEVQDWATFEALRIIFAGISNAIDDVFARKSDMYKSESIAMRALAMNRLAIDYNKSGAVTSSEHVGFGSAALVKR